MIEACSVCGGPGHPSAVGHRFVTKCAWPLGCDEQAHRGLEGINLLGQQTRYFYCEPHLTDIMSGRAFRRAVEAVESAERLGIDARNALSPLARIANDNLEAHQATCAECAAVRDWILAEMRAGRVVTREDRDRVGLYTIEHACAVGLPLFENVGKAMMG